MEAWIRSFDVFGIKTVPDPKLQRNTTCGGILSLIIKFLVFLIVANGLLRIIQGGILTLKVFEEKVTAEDLGVIDFDNMETPLFWVLDNNKGIDLEQLDKMLDISLVQYDIDRNANKQTIL